MRRTLAAGLSALIIAISAPALANPGLELFLKIPWSLGIHLFKWMNKDDKKVLYVEVTAEGADLEKARQSAFRMAVERAVGVIVSSETEVRDQRIRRDDIITYASGFVNDYKLVDQIQRGGRTLVKMQVWVSHSGLRDRLLNESRGSGQIEGGRISEQIQSFQHSRQSGDRLLESVLADFPQRAFDIVMKPTQVVVDNDRRMHLIVPFDITWNGHYVNSLKEAIKTINQRPDCGGWLSICNNLQGRIQVGDVTGYFDDQVAVLAMQRNMITSQPVLEATFFDASGRAVGRDCWNLPELTQNDYAPRPFVDIGGGQVTVWNRRVSGHLAVNLEALPVKNLDRVDVRAVRQAQCPQARR
jgi:hypothetical protein